MNTNHTQQDQFLAQEAIAMMENGRPTPRRQRHLLIEGLARDWARAYLHFGSPHPQSHMNTGSTH